MVLETKKLLASYLMEEKIKIQSVLSSVICKLVKSENKGIKTSFHIAMFAHSCRMFMQLCALHCSRKHQGLRNSRKDTLNKHKNREIYREKLKNYNRHSLTKLELKD